MRGVPLSQVREDVLDDERARPDPLGPARGPERAMPSMLTPGPLTPGPLVVERASLDASGLGVGTRRDATSVASRAVTLVAVVAPAAALLSAGGLAWGVELHPLDLVLFAIFYVATGLGITVGYHRLFTHRSFETRQWVRVALAVLGAMTLQGPLTQWVTDHRKHHARSDAEGDPHSPHLAGRGALGTVRGLWHAHVGWMFSTKGMERGALYARDLYEDPVMVLVDRLYLVWVVLSIGLPFLLGYALTGSVGRGVEAMVWAGLVRIFAFEHATFSVNSICHTFGRRTYDIGDQSRNQWAVALLTFGEGWHNNHHAFPRSARHGLGRFQLDVSWLVIRTLVACRLACAVRLPTASQRARVVLAPARD